MKDFRVEPVAQTEFEEAAVWYEAQREARVLSCERLGRRSPAFTHARIDAAGMRIVAREVAARIGAHAIVAIPTRGFSAEDRVGGALYDPDADAAFTAELVGHGVAVVEIDAHVNDEAFAARVCELLFELLESGSVAGQK